MLSVIVVGFAVGLKIDGCYAAVMVFVLMHIDD